MSLARTTARSAGVALRAMLVFTVALGLGYTLLISAVGQVLVPWQANGSLLEDGEGQVVGSALLGQSFTAADGTALPAYFQPRPSAAGEGYDGAASSGSNWGPENDDLIAAIEERRAAIVDADDVDLADIPADAVTASGSGLDPHISPEYAYLQVPRVAAERGIDETVVRALVDATVEGRDLGFLGQPRVNVLALNLALDGLED